MGASASAIINPDFPQTVIINDVWDSHAQLPSLLTMTTQEGTVDPFDDPGNLQDVVATNFTVTTPGQQFVSAGIYIELTQGHIFDERIDIAPFGVFEHRQVFKRLFHGHDDL